MISCVEWDNNLQRLKEKIKAVEESLAQRFRACCDWAKAPSYSDSKAIETKEPRRQPLNLWYRNWDSGGGPIKRKRAWITGV